MDCYLLSPATKQLQLFATSHSIKQPLAIAKMLSLPSLAPQDVRTIKILSTDTNIHSPTHYGTHRPPPTPRPSTAKTPIPQIKTPQPKAKMLGHTQIAAMSPSIEPL
jgi:hypothetical protein